MKDYKTYNSECFCDSTFCSKESKLFANYDEFAFRTFMYRTKKTFYGLYLT